MIGAPAWFVELDDFITSISIDRSSERIVVGSLSGRAMILDRDGATVAPLIEHPFGVLATAWSPDGTRCATSGHDGTVNVVDRDGNLVGSDRGAGWAPALAWSPGSNHLAAARGRRMVLLDHTGSLLHTFPEAASTVTAVSWAPNGTRLGLTAYGGITWYDIDKLADDRPSRSHRFTGAPLSLHLSPDGKWACCGFQDASIHLWRLWSGDDLSMSGYPAKIEHLDFRHDSRWMASACLDEVTVWDFGGKGPKGTRPASGTAHERHISWLGWQPGGARLITGGADGRLVLWPSPTSTKAALEPLFTAHAETAVASCAWTPDGTALVVGRSDGTVELRSVS